MLISILKDGKKKTNDFKLGLNIWGEQLHVQSYGSGEVELLQGLFLPMSGRGIKYQVRSQNSRTRSWRTL